MLREFITKQKKVLACEILESGKLTKLESGYYKYNNKIGAVNVEYEFSVDTKQVPVVGDMIMYLSKDDVYLCKRKVFDDKYSPVGMVIR